MTRGQDVVAAASVDGRVQPPRHGCHVGPFQNAEVHGQRRRRRSPARVGQVAGDRGPRGIRHRPIPPGDPPEMAPADAGAAVSRLVWCRSLLLQEPPGGGAPRGVEWPDGRLPPPGLGERFLEFRGGIQERREPESLGHRLRDGAERFRARLRGVFLERDRGTCARGVPLHRGLAAIEIAPGGGLP